MYLTKKGFAYYPSAPKDEEESVKVKQGGEVKVVRERNVAFHRKAFAILNCAFQNQDKYENENIFRQIVTIKAGVCEWVKGLDGISYPFAKSWSFDKMGAQEFEEMYKAILEVLAKEMNVTVEDLEENSKNYM